MPFGDTPGIFGSQIHLSGGDMIWGRKVLIGIAGAAVVAGLAFGTRWFVTQHGPSQSGNTEQNALVTENSGPFTSSLCQSRTFEDQPALAVLFSEPVARSQPFDRLLQVTDLGRKDGAPETAKEAESGNASPAVVSGTDAGGKLIAGNWVMGINPRILYFPYIKPQRHYRIQISEQLKAESGVMLGKVKDCRVTTEEMPPSYFFASKGTILPARQNGGLPVVTVNVSEVDVQFMRVEPAQMPYFLDTVVGHRRARDNSGEENACEDCEGGYDRSTLKGLAYVWQLDKLHEISRSVYSGRFVTSDQPNARKVTYLPVEDIKELREPGIYIAVMSQPGRFRDDYQVTYFYVTDIGLHIHRFSKGMDVFATSLTSGRAIIDAELELIDSNGKNLAEAKLDPDGHARFSGIPDQASILLAHRGKEISAVALHDPALDLSEFDMGGYLPSDIKLFLYAGRDLYRPGETFPVSMLARDTSGHILPPAPIQARLKRPDGKNVQTMTWKPDTRVAGYFQQRVQIPKDAQTGRWSIELRADPGARKADAVWTFQVEEFLPERMKLDLKTGEGALQGNADFRISVQGDYLFGAPAAGNRLLGSVSIERNINPVSRQWPGFIFGDFADDTRNKRSEMDETMLDQHGHAEINAGYDVKDAHSPMTVRASLSLLESGGRPVVRSIEKVWWPANSLIGIRPEFNDNVAQENALAGFELTRIGPDGKFAPIKTATFRLFKEDREYYWRFDDQKGWNSGFTETEEMIQSGTVALNERGKLSLPVTWGRFRLEINDQETGQTLRYHFYAGWNAQDAEDMGNRPDRVQLKLQNVPVQPGRNIRVNIKPPHDGEALIVIEADKVLWSRRAQVKTSGTDIEIPMNREWQRSDMYVAVTVFRPGNQGDKVTPARALGLAYLPIERTDRRMRVSISAPDKVLPERRTSVKVRVDGSAGKQAMVTLSAVDAGILNITRYPTPDPFDFFFGKHRYAPELLDLYGKLIEKMDGGRGTLKWGGDAGLRDTRSMPHKVRLVDLFSGPVMLDARGEADIPLDVPDFNGTLRLMAVASTADNFGKADREMVVAAPVVAELATPRFISPGDTATLALDVTNLSGAEQQLDISLEGHDLIHIRDGRKTLALRDKQRRTLRFRVEATGAYGLAHLQLTVRGKGQVPVAIHRESVLQVQPAVPLVHEIRRIQIRQDGQLQFPTHMASGFFKDSANVSVSISNQPPLNVQSIALGLFNYPYGCLEQTTSTAYPYVLIDDAAAKAFGLAPMSRDERTRVIELAISRIAGMQGARGGFNLWGNGPYETWLTAYATGFLLDAREQGFEVPDLMIKHAESWMLSTLQSAPTYFPSLPKNLKPDAQGHYRYSDYELLRNSHERFAEMAHIAFVLAREQKAPLATLRILHDQYRNRARSPLPLVHLGLALQMMGDSARAKIALSDAMKIRYGIQPDQRWEWLGHDYGSRTRDLALSYALLTHYKVQDPHVENMLFDAANSLGQRTWLSTQERLALLLAATAQGQTAGKNTQWTAILHQGGKHETLSSNRSETRPLDVRMLEQDPGSLENKTSAPLFVEIESSGYPLRSPAPRSDVIHISRDWFSPDGRNWNGGTLEVGDMLIARITVTAQQNIEEGMVIDHIPAGLEVENLNLSQGPQTAEFSIDGINVAQAIGDSRIRHQEYRDDRYVAAVKLGRSKLTLFYLLRVVTPGTFTVPSIYAEDMYRPEIRGVGIQQSPISITDPRYTEKD